MKLTEKQIVELRKRKYDFDAIGAVVAAHTRERLSFSDISLDAFYDKEGCYHEYIIMRYENGGFMARNADDNSLGADIQEMAKMIFGGYYNECDVYEAYKKGSKKI